MAKKKKTTGSKSTRKTSRARKARAGKARGARSQSPEGRSRWWGPNGLRHGLLWQCGEEGALASAFAHVPAPRPVVRLRFLVRVPRPDGETAYFHSLFGTSLVLNREAEALLETFRRPARIGRRDRVLDAFVQRRFLVDVTIDERAEFVTAMRPEKPEAGAHLQGLLLLAAEQCNLACPYCIKDKLMDLRPERPQARIAVEAARQAIDAFVAVAERGPHTDLGLQFRGGEALLNAEVVLDATRYMRARWTRGDVVTSMVSNATLVTEALARALAELGITVEVSIDGPRAVHDLVRITKGGRPTYDRVVAGLARLVAAGVEVTNVNTTVTAETLPLIDAVLLRRARSARRTPRQSRAGCAATGPA